MTDLSRAQPLSICDRHPPNSWATVIGIASIKCVRPVLTTRANSPRSLFEHRTQAAQRGEQILGEKQCRCDVNRRRHHVVAALTHVHVIVRVHRLAQRTAGQRGDDLVGVHVAARARAGLKYVQRKLIVIPALRHLERCGLDRGGEARRQVAEIGIRGGSGALDESQGANERARHAQPAGGEILDRALRLRAPQGSRRHVERAHAVMLDAIGRRCHRVLLRRCVVVYGNIVRILSLTRRQP